MIHPPIRRLGEFGSRIGLFAKDRRSQSMGIAEADLSAVKCWRFVSAKQGDVPGQPPDVDIHETETCFTRNGYTRSTP
jgi:hypothetical protein